MIYLDHNATSLVRSSVRDAMHAVEALPLNASSVHKAGRKAKQLLEGARKSLADYLSVFPHEVIFTASATEANNTALRALAPTHPLLVSTVEHPCVLNTGLKLGASVIVVDAKGVVDLAVLDAKLASVGRAALVSVMLVNNETGVIQPIEEVAHIVKKHGGKLHVDAVQAFGKMPIDLGTIQADMLTISAHKIGGPVGVGALILRDDKGFVPLLTGGGQERGLRAGTENIPAIIGLSALIDEISPAAMQAQQQTWHNLREQFIQTIRQYAPEAPVYGAKTAQMPNTIMVGMPGMGSETQLMHFDLADIAVSAGSACSSGKVQPSHVLRAMGVPLDEAAQAIRISMGYNTTFQEVQTCAENWLILYRKAISNGSGAGSGRRLA